MDKYQKYLLELPHTYISLIVNQSKEQSGIYKEEKICLKQDFDITITDYKLYVCNICVDAVFAVKGENKIAFVAQYKEVKDGDADDIYTYLINEDGIMSLNPAAQITPQNGDCMDVYVNYDIVTAASEAQRNITLHRPVAQINIGTSASELPRNMVISLGNVPVSYNIFNPDSNTAYSSDITTLTFTGEPHGGVLEAGGVTYNRLATFYVLGGNTLLCTFKFTYDGSESVVRTVDGVTTAVNHKTNIVGKL